MYINLIYDKITPVVANYLFILLCLHEKLIK